MPIRQQNFIIENKEFFVYSVGATSGKLPPVICKISAHWFYLEFNLPNNDFSCGKQISNLCL